MKKKDHGKLSVVLLKKCQSPKKVVIEHSYIRYRKFPALKVQMVILHEARFSNDHIYNNTRTIPKPLVVVNIVEYLPEG
ncbi:MAG: hypothetical protein NTV89_01350 [Proteobacteria bacterium]|nr:hypothetical protein [Pseudomonadota bacterium]